MMSLTEISLPVPASTVMSTEVIIPRPTLHGRDLLPIDVPKISLDIGDAGEAAESLSTYPRRCRRVHPAHGLELSD